MERNPSSPSGGMDSPITRSPESFPPETEWKGLGLEIKLKKILATIIILHPSK